MLFLIYYREAPVGCPQRMAKLVGMRTERGYRKNEYTDMAREKRKRKNKHIMLWVIFLEAAALTVGLVYLLLSREDLEVDTLLQQDLTIEYVEETKPDASGSTNPVPRPDIDVQLLTKNKYSRPGKKTDETSYIVVHYLANPRTTAQENHDYFESLKDLKDVSMSANYVI